MSVRLIPFVLNMKCPYCGYVNQIRYDDYVEACNNGGWAVFTCDSEEGGCDKDFVVHVKLQPVVETLPIGGQQE